MLPSTNRDSSGSTASRASNGRLIPSRPLSISVPPASPFLPSSISRTTYSLSTEQWGDRALHSGSSEEEHELGEHEDGDSAGEWVDDGEEEGSEHLERERLLGGNLQAERLYSSPGQEDEEDGETPEAPTTPVTLPPTSFASSPPPFPHSYSDVGTSRSSRSSFPSSEEDPSTGPSGLSHAERLRMAEAEDGPERQEDREMQLEEEGWTRQGEEVMRVQEEGGAPAEQPRFAAFHESPPSLAAVNNDDGGSVYRLDRDLPPLPLDSRPATPASTSMHSPRPSTTHSSSSSNSSTLSLPTEPPVDLTLPNLSNRPGGTFMSVASGPMAHLADSGSARTQTRGPRSFFSNILSRAAGHRPPNLPSANSSTASLSPPSRSPSAPDGFHHPSVGAAIRNGAHARSSSLPSPDPNVSAHNHSRSSLNSPLERNGPGAPIPRSPVRGGLASGLLRSASFRTPRRPAMTSAPPSPIPSSLLGTSSSGTGAQTTPEPPRTTRPPAPPPPPQPSLPPQTLGSIGLGLVPLTASLSLSRNSQPLCGALLDGKYILIGTTGGLDFLPIPFPGCLPMRSHGKKRRETRKPISLIKRTRFRELAVLSERSNILLAIAGRNDHIRVYALDGIRAMIERKMAELDVRDGYPVNPDSSQLVLPPLDLKGKGRAVPPPLPTTLLRHSTFPRQPAPPAATSKPSTSSSPFHFPGGSPPPDYAPTPSSPLRQPSSSTMPPSPSHNSFFPSNSPIRPSSRALAPSGSTVRGIPTNPRASPSRSSLSTSPSSLRGSKSRDFVAARRSATASIAKRRSRADMRADGGSGSRSRRSSIYSGDERPLPPSPVPSPPVPPIDEALVATAPVEEARDYGDFLSPSTRHAHRRTSTTSTDKSGWTTDRSQTPLISRPLPRAEPRPAATSAERRGQSAAMDLADFLRSSGPGLSFSSPVCEDGDGEPMATRSVSIEGAVAGGRPLEGGPRERLASGRIRHVPRSATVTSRDEDGYSASLELADFLRAGPPGPGTEQTTGALSAKTITREASQARLRPDQRSPSFDVADSLPQTSAPNRKLAREASTTRLRAGERSTTQELSDLLRDTGPSPTAPREKEHLRTRKEPREAARPHQQSSTLELAEFFKATGPNSSTSIPSALRANGASRARPMSQCTTRSSDHPPSPTATASSPLNRSKSLKMEPRDARATNAVGEREAENDLPGARRREATSLAQAIRDGPPADYIDSRDAGTSSPTSSPGNRHNKRWTMSGMGSLFLSRPAGPTEEGSSSPNPQSSSRPSSDVPRPPITQDRPTNSLGRHGQEADEILVVQQLASRPLPPHDFKQRRDLLEPAETPTLPASSQLPPDTHTGSASSPLEYVKLARTKGARLLRACETKKRTYLAVLCGDEGERIELFTGSRSISLSLNRTFVLPENPRTIEFQLQGDDLVDIYLVYPESIFALEPATVRVREVGVGRGERRARRDREPRMQDIASIDEHGLAPPEPPTATLHPADPALTETPPRPITPDNSAGDLEGLAMGLDVGSRSPSPSLSRPPSRAASPPPPPLARESSASPPPIPPRNPDSSSSDQPPPVPPRNKHILPYSTFQQLPFVPPVPSSVLSSAWIIPPLYTDVVESGAAASFVSPSTSSTENPAITITGDSSSSFADNSTPPQFDTQQLPLLSPISLLGGAAQRANGPPGLFFVSKGRNLSGIVTADGRSVIKKPLVWSLEKPAKSETLDVYHRVEVLVVGGNKTVIVGIGSSDAKAIAVGGGTGEAPFGAAVPVTSRPTSKPSDMAAVREVQFLGTHAPTNQLFISERVGANFLVYALFSK